MTISLVLTIHNRTPEVQRHVAASFALDGNQPDEAVIVLDRPTDEARSGSTVWTELLDCPVKLVELDGDPGWRGPARAWNHAFKAASGDLLYCISSEVVQAEGNVTKARQLSAGLDPVVLLGACHNSLPTHLVTGAEPGLLASSSMPRPLGFIACIPAKSVEQIGGFDEAFMGTTDQPGYWYDDDDFYLRLWRAGLDFVFDDSISGTHLDHPRPVLETPVGQAGIARNRALMIQKHGTPHPWPTLTRTEDRKPGRTVWRHV